MHIPLGDSYYFLFTTRSFSTGAPATLAGTPVLSVYEENNLTQITSGVSVSVDYDSVTGLNQATVVATSGNGYEVGKYYDVVITTGTVGGVSVVGEVVGHFRVMSAEDAGAGIPDVNVLGWNDVLLTTTNPLPNAAPDAAGGLPISDAGGLDLDTLLGYLTAAVATASELAKVPKSDGTATWNAAALASINAEADTALSDFFTSAAALVDLILDEAISGHLGAGTMGLYLAIAGGVIVDTTVTGTPTSTEIQFSGGSTTANFYQDKFAYVISGTAIGQGIPILSSSYSGGTTTLTFDETWKVAAVAGDRLLITIHHVHPLTQITEGVRAEMDSNSTQLAAILADTNELQTDWTNGGRLDLLIDAILADTGTDIPALIAALDALIDAIKAKTDSLTFTQAGHVDSNVQRINDVAITGDGNATPFDVV